MWEWAAALAYVLNHKHRVASLAVGHGLGAPGPFKLAFMISMLAKFGVMRFTNGVVLGAGPLIAFSSQAWVHPSSGQRQANR